MYDQMGDHLQAEFDRIHLALTSIAEGAVDPAGVEAEGIEHGDQPGDSLATVGETVRSLAGVADDQRGAFSGSERHQRLDDEATEIENTLAASREGDADLRLDRLTRACGLSRTELDAFLLALAPAFDRTVYRLYGQIQGSPDPELPTIGFLETVLVQMGHGTDDGSTTPPGEALSAHSPLFEFKLLERHQSDPAHPSTQDILTVDERIVQFLKGSDNLDSTLDDVATVAYPDRRLGDLVFDEETTETLEAIDARSRAADQPSIFYLSGEDGTGKDRLPEALTDSATPILRARAEDVLTDEDRFTRLLREAILRDGTIHLEAVEEITEGDEGPDVDVGESEDGGIAIDEDSETPSVDDIVERLDQAPGDVFLTHTDDWTPDVDLTRHRLETCACPFPTHAVRLAIWEEYEEEFENPDLTSHIAMNFRLPQRDIRRAVKTARYLCRTDDEDADNTHSNARHGERDEQEPRRDGDFQAVDGELSRDHLYSACKRYSASNLDALAEQLDPGYTWDDIALNDRQESHLRELCGHLQYRGAVTNEWGFGEPGSRGDGVVALFYGQPGTGKTMAAEVIANETGLDLYRVDLSQIINKYVGETESRLATLLDEAERSNAILLFDEADSIFGKRAEVKDATDRYANTEINFLLQRLESFDGILLLTTNKRSGIDSAFKRRIQHAIEFRKPQELIRQEFWKEVFPDEASVATEEFDYDFLGRILTTPALIRKVATYAAYISATEAHDGRPLADEQADLSEVTITFDHVVRALQYAREAGGAGFQVDFGEYEDKLRRYESHGVERDMHEELRRLQDDGEEWDGETTVTAEAADGNGTTPGKQSADQVDPGDGRSPEEVIREFFARLADADESAHDLYHSSGQAEEFSYRNLQLMKHGDLSIVSEMARLQNDHDRVVVEFEQRLSGTHVPDEIDGKPLPVRYELRPQREGWRIFDITRAEDVPSAR